MSRTAGTKVAQGWRAGLLLAALAVAGTVQPVRTAPAPQLPPELGAVPRDAWAVLSVRMGEIYRSDAARSLRTALEEAQEGTLISQALGVPSPSAIERFTVFRAGPSGETLAIVTAAKDFDRKQVLEHFGPVGPPRKTGDVAWYRDESDWTAIAFLDARSFLVGDAGAVEDYLERPRPGSGPLTAALRRAVRDKQFVAWADFAGPGGESLRQMLRAQKLPALPGRLRTLTAEVDFRDGLQLDARLTFADAAEARAGRLNLLEARGPGLKLLDDLGEYVNAPKDAPPVTRFPLELVRGVRAALKAVDPVQDGADVRVSLRVRSPEPASAVLSLVFFRQTFLAGGLGNPPPQGDDKLSRIAAALLAYHKEHGRLPPHALYKGGQPLLSWRVLLLPHLGEEKLFKEFRLDEPWDGPHNRRLVGRMPAVFAGGGFGDARPTTQYQVFVGKGTLFEGKKGVSLKGTDAGTLLAAVAHRRVPWSKPEDLLCAPDKPLPPLGDSFKVPGGFHAAFADGRVRLLYTGELHDDDRLSGSPLRPARSSDDMEGRKKLVRKLATGSGSKVDLDRLREAPAMAPAGEGNPRMPR
jgi:hypothetical protein